MLNSVAIKSWVLEVFEISVVIEIIFESVNQFSSRLSCRSSFSEAVRQFHICGAIADHLREAFDEELVKKVLSTQRYYVFWLCLKFCVEASLLEQFCGRKSMELVFELCNFNLLHNHSTFFFREFVIESKIVFCFDSLKRRKDSVKSCEVQLVGLFINQITSSDLHLH